MNKNFWDELLDLESMLQHWVDRISFYNDASYLSREKVGEQLSQMLDQVGVIKSKINQAEHEAHWYGEEE